MQIKQEQIDLLKQASGIPYLTSYYGALSNEMDELAWEMQDLLDHHSGNAEA